MALWIAWWNVAAGLRPACSRTRCFLWLLAVLAGMCVRSDLLGVSSLVRGLGLMEASYGSLLDFFHSGALDPNHLSRIWSALTLRIFPDIPRFNGRLLLVGDGIKIPKAGKKMPAVKMLHQESTNNTKPEYIMGHSCQAVSLLAGRGHHVFAVPLAARIHEGVVFSNRDKRTLFDKMLSLIDALDIGEPFYFIGDAYYACKKMGLGLHRDGNHLLTRVHRNAVAWTPAAPAEEEKRRGRPRKYGKKLKLQSLFDDSARMTTADSPVYGEKDVKIAYRCRDLLWRPLGRLVRFVAVHHPVRGKCLLMCTDVTLAPSTSSGCTGGASKSKSRSRRHCGYWVAMPTISGCVS